MKNIFLCILMVLFVLIVVSCKKVNSCEGCRKNNKTPIVTAGPDQLITLPIDSVLLDGSASNDPNGTISAWQWKKISGPVSFNITQPSSAKTIVKNLTAGIYLFELMVKDNAGLSATDTVQITVIQSTSINRPPVANAGYDYTIIYPSNLMIDGSGSVDPDNNIVSYLWVKISGPTSFTMGSVKDVRVNLSGLVVGVYQFELKVTDSGGLFSRDTMQVTVVEPPPACTDCRIVFVSDRDGNPEIYSCKADGTNIQRLTNSEGIDEHPVWSPDGSRIAFISDRSGNTELYIMNRDGSNVIRKTFSGNVESPAWSSDGIKIVYSTISNGSMNLWVIAAAGDSPFLLFTAPGYDAQPSWSPDGTKIALVSDWAAYDFVYDIYTINANGTGFTTLTGNIFDHLDYLNPCWSPNGTMLAMAISQTIGIDQYYTQVGIMNPDGSGIKAIKAGAAPWMRVSWSNNGTMIAYTSMSGSGRDVSWVSADGSASGLIVANGWNADWQK